MCGGIMEGGLQDPAAQKQTTAKYTKPLLNSREGGATVW
jgi:hypothetical protein